MIKVIKGALDNVNKHPAIYTIMVLVIFVCIVVNYNIKSDINKIFVLGICLLTEVIIYYLTVKTEMFQPKADDNSVIALSSDNPLNDKIIQLENACRSVSKEKDSDHPLLNMLGGFLVQLSEEIAQNSIEIAPKYYSSCFSTLNDLNITNIYAIADLSADLENWDAGHPTLWKGVKKRLFHMQWEDMYNKELDLLMEGLKQDSAEIVNSQCNISLITSRETAQISHRHPLTDKHEIGKHLLIIGDKLIGGYIKAPDGDKLYLQAANEIDVRAAKDFFNKLNNNAVPISPDMTANDIRAKWLEKFSIGLWDPEWNGSQERDDRYVMEYDRHIHCWIPDYAMLIDKCYLVVRTELDKISRANERPINILELGCGTGSLTAKIAQWAINLDELSESPIQSYLIVDQSSKMITLAKNRLNQACKYGYEKFTSFEQLKFTAESENNYGKKYNLIFGSLVFHFLLGKVWSDQKIVDTFEQLQNEWLTDNGCVIFADIFFTKRNKELEQAYWKEHMTQFGMSSQAIDVFLKNNQDMVNAPTYEKLTGILANKKSYAEIIPTPIYGNPFNIVKIGRVQRD